MKDREEGWTLIEILVVITIIASLAGLVSVMASKAHRKKVQVVCTKNVQELVGLLESADRYPAYDGPDLVLYLAFKGDLQGGDALTKLFCPGDEFESYDLAGGEAAFTGLALDQPGDRGGLTSYAGRAQRDVKCRAGKGSARPLVLVADDSDDHHFGEGIVVGLTGGAARFRDKVEDYDLDADAPIEIGTASSIEELRRLRSD